MLLAASRLEKNLRIERVELPGETKSVMFVLSSPDLALWDQNMRFG